VQVFVYIISNYLPCAMFNPLALGTIGQGIFAAIPRERNKLIQNKVFFFFTRCTVACGGFGDDPMSFLHIERNILPLDYWLECSLG